MSDRNPLDAFKAFVDLCSTLDIELDFKAIEKLHECLNNLAPVEPEKSCQFPSPDRSGADADSAPPDREDIL